MKKNFNINIKIYLKKYFLKKVLKIKKGEKSISLI